MGSRNRSQNPLTELDRRYPHQTIGQISRRNTTGIVNQRVNELQAEAKRLQENGEKLKTDNSVLRALTADFETELKREMAIVDFAADQAQTSAIEAAGDITKRLAGLTDETLSRIGVTWSTPDPRAIEQLVNYTNNPAFRQRLVKFGDIADRVQEIAIRGMATGQSPAITARQIQNIVENFPTVQANNIIRTVQLESYRGAALAHEVANATLFSHKIRIETLDGRTCLSCWGLHGQVMEIGERFVEHEQGRGTTVLVVKGRELTVQSGADRLNQLLQSEKQGTITETGKFTLQTMREKQGSSFEAIESGRANLGQFAKTYQDDVYGDMLYQPSLDELGIRQ